jgi:hypothetical protein
MRQRAPTAIAVVVALAAGVFAYQWWSDPARAIARRLDALAATLSVPPDAQDELSRVARLAQLRSFLAPDVTVTLGRTGRTLASRDALLGAVGAWKPPSDGWQVDFEDVEVAVGSSETARAHLTIIVSGPDPETGGDAVDAREADVDLAVLDGTWVVTAAALVETIERP